MPVTNNLILQLDASNLSSYPGYGTNWTDISGNAYNYVLVGDTTFSDGSINFQNGAKASSPNFGGVTFIGDFTFEVWINSDSLNGNILSERNGDSWFVSLMDLVNGTMRVGFWTGGTSYIDIGTVTPGLWYQIVMKYSSGTLTGYINGVIGNTLGGFSKLYPDSNYYVEIADYEPTNFGYGGNFTGRISDVRFYNRALTDEEVLQNYNETSIKFAPKKKSVRFHRSSKLKSIPPITYKYYKWHITAVKQDLDSFLQLSEFKFQLNGVDTDMSSVSLSLLNGHTSPQNEQIENIKDGNTVTKFLDYNFESGGTEILFDFPTQQAFNGYRWATGNDDDWRDPRSWIMYGSNDNSNWTVLDSVTDFVSTTDRQTFNQPFIYTNGLDANTLPSNVTISNREGVKDGSTPNKAGDSAFQIKTKYPNSTDGVYWIKNLNINGGNPFQIYADMTTDGGGWTLLVTNQNTNGWTYENAILLNEYSPVIEGANYSIVAWADYIKRPGTTFQYMMDAYQRNSFGGIWSAPQSYTFLKSDNTQTGVVLDIKFGTWNYNNSSIEQRMPWYSDNNGVLTTSENPNGEWWGTIITRGNWGPAPWISSDCGLDGCMSHPGIIWYWVR